jgi:cysteine dioxygenase
MAPPQVPINLVIHEPMNDTYKAPSCADDFKLSDLVQSIHTALGDEGLDSEKVDVNQIIHLMEKYSSNAKDWSKYTLFDHSRAYTRNLIDDGNGKVGKRSSVLRIITNHRYCVVVVFFF